jgi:hypothetical protein
MPRIEGTFPPPIHGVSTVKPRNRGIGYCESQENFRSDIVDKLTRRPSLVWGQKLMDITEPFNVHTYIRGENRFRIIVETEHVPGSTNVRMTNNGVDIPAVDFTNIPIITEDLPYLKFMTIKDDTYVMNTKQEPDFEKFTYTDPDTLLEVEDYLIEDHPIAGCTTEKVSHVNFTVAGEYGESFKMSIADTTIVHTYDCPKFSSGASDTLALRSTSFLAQEFAVGINAVGNILGVFAAAKGSGLAIWRADAPGGVVPVNTRSPFDWVRVELETGQGDRSAVPINERLEKVDGLPLYAVAGTRVTIRPRPSSDDGTYFLEAVPVEGEYIPNSHGRLLEEVVWEEHRSPHEPYRLDPETMPHIVNYEDGEMTVRAPEWKDRRTGNKDSCPPPTFLDSRTPLRAMNYFQNRLVFLSDDEVHMTETDDLDNWWKASAIQTLVTDPIGIKSSAPDVDVLQQATAHNKDLLVLAQNGQFKIDGKVAVTPQTVSMQLTTAYEVRVEPAPVSIGNSSFIPMIFGDSAGLHEYTGQVNTSQDTAFNIATHIKGYIPGSIKLLASSPNLEMLALTATRSGDNVIYVYDQMTDRTGERKQQSWSRWAIPASNEIININMSNDLIELLIVEDNVLYAKYMNIHTGESPDVGIFTALPGGLKDVYLDNHMVLKTLDGYTVTLPDDYVWQEKTIVVLGDNTTYPRTLADYTRDGRVITFKDSIGLGMVEIGECFTSSYIPTRPYKRDGDNQSVTTDRVRVSRYRVSVVESYEMWMHIISDYYNGEDQEFNSRIMNANNNLIGDEPFTTDEVVFGFSQDAKYASPEFYTDGFLELTIDGITWEGQYYQSSRRM